MARAPKEAVVADTNALLAPVTGAISPARSLERAPVAPAIAVVGPPAVAPPADELAPGASEPPLPTPAPALAPGGEWPSRMPDAADAAEALLRALAGALASDAPLAGVAAQVLGGLSALEREVLAGDPQPFDPAPVHAAAVMRLRVAAALAHAPPPGAAVDGAMLQEILGEIDGLLAEVKALLRDAPQEARPGLEAVRNALVREAIEFSEVAGGRAPRAASAIVTTAVPRAPARTRMLAVDAPGRRRRPTALLAVLGVVAAGVLGYHGWRLHVRPQPVLPPTLAGAPAGTLGVDRGASRVLMTLPGEQVDPAELERFRRLEASRGNVLRTISPGTWVIERGPAPPGGAP